MGLFSSNAGADKKAALGAQQTIASGQTQAKDDINLGLDQANQSYNRVSGLWEPSSDRYQKGSDLFSDALGVNGADGTARATSAFTSSPGYTFNLDQGLQALQRTRAASGSLASGNADTDAMRFASGLASNDYNTWLSNLGGYDGKLMTSLSGQSSPLMAGGAADLSAGLARGTTDYSGAVASGNALLKGQELADKSDQTANANVLGLLGGAGNLIASGAGTLAGNPNALSNIKKSVYNIFG